MERSLIVRAKKQFNFVPHTNPPLLFRLTDDNVLILTAMDNDAPFSPCCMCLLPKVETQLLYS